MRGILGLVLMVVGLIGAGYIAIWWGIVQPIMTIAEAIDTDTVSATLIGKEVIKFFLKEVVAGIWFYVFVIWGYTRLLK